MVDRKTKKEIKEQKLKNKKDVFFNLHKPEIPSGNIYSIGSTNSFLKVAYSEFRTLNVNDVKSWKNASFKITQDLERSWDSDDWINQKEDSQKTSHSGYAGQVVSGGNNSINLELESTPKDVQETNINVDVILPTLSPEDHSEKHSKELPSTELTSTIPSSLNPPTTKKIESHLIQTKVGTNVFYCTKLLEKSLEEVRQIIIVKVPLNRLHLGKSYLFMTWQYLLEHKFQALHKIFKRIKRYGYKIHLDIDKTLEAFFGHKDSIGHWKSYEALTESLWESIPILFQSDVKRLSDNLDKWQKELNTYRLQEIKKSIKAIDFIDYIEEPQHKDNIYKYNLINIICDWFKKPHVEGIQFAASNLEEQYANKYISFFKYLLKDCTEVTQKLLVDPSKGFLVLIYYYKFDAHQSITTNYNSFIILVARFIAFMESPHSDEKALENFCHKYKIKSSIVNRLYAFFGNSGNIIITNLLLQKIYGGTEPKVTSWTESDQAWKEAHEDYLSKNFKKYVDNIKVKNTKGFCLYPTLNLWYIVLGIDSFEKVVPNLNDLSKMSQNILNVFVLMGSVDKDIFVHNNDSLTPYVSYLLRNIMSDPLEGLLWICHHCCSPQYREEKNYHRLVYILAKAAALAHKMEAVTLADIKQKVVNTEAIYNILNPLKKYILEFIPKYNKDLADYASAHRIRLDLVNVDEMLRIITLGQSMFIPNKRLTNITYTNYDHIKTWSIYNSKQIIDINLLEKMFAIQENLMKAGDKTNLLTILFSSFDNESPHYNQVHNYNKKLLIMFLAFWLPEEALYGLVFDKSNGIYLLMAYYQTQGEESEQAIIDMHSLRKMFKIIYGQPSLTILK